MRRMLFLTVLDIWAMGDGKGAPSQSKTIYGYAENGWEVCVLTTFSEPCNYHPNISYHSIGGPVSNKRFENSVLQFIWTPFLFTVLLINFTSYGLYHYIGDKYSLIYAYEIHTVPAGKILSLLTSRTLVTRFQGTKIPMWWNDRLWYLKRWNHVIALWMPSDLVVMTNDGTMGDVVLKKLGHEDDKILFIKNGVDKELFNKKTKTSNGTPATDTESIRLLTVSRLVSWKRVDRAIYQVKKLVDLYPNTELFIVGDGPKLSILKKLAEDLALENHVHFVGSIPREEVAIMMNNCDFFVSMYDLSNLGNPVIEAMNCGCTVIALDRGGTSDVINHLENGVLVSEPCELPLYIGYLIENSSFRMKIEGNAERFSKTEFRTWNERMSVEEHHVRSLLEN